MTRAWRIRTVLQGGRRGGPLLLVLAVSILLAACGRVGPVRPPGPADQVTYPRAYPAPDPPGAGTAPAR